jgi:hypothetical protein
MNRNDTKCADLPRFPTLAAAQAEAARYLIKRVAYPCECGGFHVVKVGKSQRQERREAYDDYYGDLLKICRTMIDREIARMGVRRRRRK